MWTVGLLITPLAVFNNSDFFLPVGFVQFVLSISWERGAFFLKRTQATRFLAGVHRFIMISTLVTGYMAMVDIVLNMVSLRKNRAVMRFGEKTPQIIVYNQLYK